MCGKASSDDCRASSECDAAMLRCHCSKCASITLGEVFAIRIECETHLPPAAYGLHGRYERSSGWAFAEESHKLPWQSCFF